MDVEKTLYFIAHERRKDVEKTLKRRTLLPIEPLQLNCPDNDFEITRLK